MDVCVARIHPRPRLRAPDPPRIGESSTTDALEIGPGRPGRESSGAVRRPAGGVRGARGGARRSASGRPDPPRARRRASGQRARGRTDLEAAAGDGFAPPGRPPHPRRFGHDVRVALLAARHRQVWGAAPGRSRPAVATSSPFRARREPAFGRRTTCRGARARGRGQGGLADGRPFRLELGPGVRRFRVWRPGPARISGRRGAVPRQVRPDLRAGAAPRGVGGEGVGRRRRRAAIRGRGLGGRGRVRAQARARASFGAGVGCRGSSGP